MNGIFGMTKEGVPPSSAGTPAHLRVIATSSAHVMFAGNFARVISTVCDKSCRYHKTLVSIEDPVTSEVGNLMDTAFQLAGDLALFDEIVRAPCRSEQAATRMTLAFGEACARAWDRPHDRVIAVARFLRHRRPEKILGALTRY